MRTTPSANCRMHDIGRLMPQYAKEQDTLEIEIAELEKAVTGYEQS